MYMQPGALVPHVERVNLFEDGILEDVISLAHLNNGDFHYIRIEALDDVDKDRIFKILKKRNADKMPLWDLLGEISLPNGVNALRYFSQLIMVKTPNNKHFRFNPNKSGAGYTRRQINEAQALQEAAVQTPKTTKKDKA